MDFSTILNTPALKSELEWIDRNVHRYDSPLHAESVKRNIEKRYYIQTLHSHIHQFEKEMFLRR